MQRVGKRYAKAFFLQSDGNVAQARANLASLEQLKALYKNAEAAKVLSSPVMPPDLKQSLLDYALDLGQASVGTRDFIKTLVAAQRTDIIPDVIVAYAELIDASEGKVSAEIISAVALDDASRQEISQALEKVLKKKIELVPEIDPSLMGGFKVRVGNFLVDLSLKTRLDSLSAGAVADRIG